MDNLVFLKSQDLNEEPFTTSEIISKYGAVEHHAVQELIRKHRVDFEEFGQLAFEMRAVENHGTKFEKVYNLNEDQATLLITFMKNTPQVVQFKKNLVKQFRVMVNELNKRAITRAIVKEGRKQLTDIVKEKLPDSKWAYKHLTDLDYKCVLGMSAKKFEETYNIPDGKIRSYISSDQLTEIGIIEAAEKALVGAGYTYHEIKDILSRKFIGRKTG